MKVGRTSTLERSRLDLRTCKRGKVIDQALDGMHVADAGPLVLPQGGCGARSAGIRSEIPKCGKSMGKGVMQRRSRVNKRGSEEKEKNSTMDHAAISNQMWM